MDFSNQILETTKQHILQSFQELMQIFREKNYNKTTQELLMKWFLQIACYDPEIDILYSKKIEDHLSEHLEDLRKVEYLRVLSIEEVLEGQSPMAKVFNSYIEPLPQGYKSEYQFEQSGNQFILNSNGTFYLSTVGLAIQKSSSIFLVDSKTSIEDFEHELTHIKQGKDAYDYASYYPFSFEFRTMMREGEAEYRKNICEKNLDFNKFTWNDFEEKNNPYRKYFQMYVLLMAALPNNFKESWKAGEFRFDMIPDEYKHSYFEIFANITIILSKMTGQNLEESLKQSQKDCIFLLSESSQDISDESTSYEYGIQLADTIFSMSKEKNSMLQLFQNLISQVESILIKTGNIEMLESLQPLIEGFKENKISKY